MVIKMRYQKAKKMSEYEAVVVKIYWRRKKKRFPGTEIALSDLVPTGKISRHTEILTWNRL
jgi:hypothetical protein